MLQAILSTIYAYIKAGGTIVGNWAKRIWSYTKELGRWINRNRRDLLHIITAIIVGLLFIGMIDSQNKSHQLISGESTIIDNQSRQISEQKQEIAALSSHVDCLFNLATHQNHSSAYIAQPNTCGIVTPPESVAPSDSSATFPQNSQNSNKTNTGSSGATTQTQNSQNNSGNSTPVPKKCRAKILFVCL